MSNTPPPADAAVVKNMSRGANALRLNLVQGAIFILTTALYAVLIITDRVPALGLIGLVALWLTYALLSGRLTFSTPLDLPILVLLGLLPFSLAISIDRGLSLPKIYGLLLGVALFYLLVNSIRNYDRLHLVILALVFLAIGTALLGVMISNGSSDRLSFLPPIQNLLQRAQQAAPFSGDRGVNANTIGGALTFFVPLLGSLLWDRGAFYRSSLRSYRNRHRLSIAYKVLLGGAFLLVLGALILTRSRGAYLGCAAGLFALLILKDRRFLWLIPILLVNGIFVLYYFGEGDLWTFLIALDTSPETTLQDRLALWRSAVGIIQDFPLTGAGIFTFSKVLGEVYTSNIFSTQSPGVFHAHNLYLSIAFDLGIPGLVLYSALLSSFGIMAYRTISLGRSIIRVLVVGLVGGMVGHHAFGLVDANALGTKLGAILWIFLGLMAALHAHKRYRGWREETLPDLQPGLDILKLNWEPIKQRLNDLLIGLGAWFLISLVAVIFITHSPYLSIALAIAGGVLLGIILTRQFQPDSIKLKGQKTEDRDIAQTSLDVRVRLM